MAKNLQVTFIKAWRRQSLWLFLLLPLELIYRFLNYSDWLVKTKILSRHSLKVPLVIIGSIVLGGSGKTPAVISLVKQLTARGFKVGIISRGYKSDNKVPKEVTPMAKASEVGDEPLLIACATGCPLFIGADRYITARRMLHRHRLDVIVSDDGLQHYRLAGDIEVAMVDHVMGLSNKHCLPVGPLREPASRLKEVDFVVKNLANQGEYLPLKDKRAKNKPAQKVPAEDLAFTGKKIYAMRRESISCIKLSDNNLTNLQADVNKKVTTHPIDKWIKLSQDKEIHAVAGIAQPQNFFNLLQEHGVKFIPHTFANHHKFSASDINFIDADKGANKKDKIIIMTEKDAIKCSEFSENANLWALRINYELDNSFVNKLVSKL